MSMFCSFSLSSLRVIPCSYISIMLLKYYLCSSDYKGCYRLLAYPCYSGNINSSTAMGTFAHWLIYSCSLQQRCELSNTCWIQSSLLTHATITVRFTFSLDQYCQIHMQNHGSSCCPVNNFFKSFAFSCISPISCGPQWFLTSIRNQKLACFLNVFPFAHERRAGCSIASLKASYIL